MSHARVYALVTTLLPPRVNATWPRQQEELAVENLGHLVFRSRQIGLEDVRSEAPDALDDMDLALIRRYHPINSGSPPSPPAAPRGSTP